MSEKWVSGELGTHSYADDPHYSVHMNGKVDINPQTGTSENKIELTVNGMYKLVYDWLKSGHQLDDKKRAELISLIAYKNNSYYNTNSKVWEDKKESK